MTSAQLVTLCVVLLVSWNILPAWGQSLAVTIDVDYTPPPDFVGGTNDYRACSTVTLSCQVEGATGSETYQWTSTCTTPGSNCFVPGKTTQVITRSTLRSTDSGTHVCTATRGGLSGSDTIVMNIVGAGIFVNTGDDTNVPTDVLPNNGIVIALTSGTRISWQCRSGSSMTGVGQLVDLDGNTFNIGQTSGEFAVAQFGGGSGHPGSVQFLNRDGTETLTAADEGVYSCRIPDESDNVVDVNIGVYRNGFNTAPNVSSLTYNSPARTLTCTSTNSPATNVTWTRDGATLIVDGDPRAVIGATYDVTQTVTDRSASTYENVLTLPATGDISGTYGCLVGNALGNSNTVTADVTVQVEITGSADPPVAGTPYTLTCSVTLGGGLSGLDPTVEWRDPRGEMITGDSVGGVTGSGTSFTSTLSFTPLQPSDGGVYTCEATSGLVTGTGTMDVIVQSTLIVEITPSGGDTVAGEQYTLTCTVTVPESSGLSGTPSVEWIGEEGKTGVTEGTAETSGRVTTLTLTFNPLQDSQDGMYTCSASLPVPGMVPATGLNIYTLDVVAPEVTVNVSATGDPIVGGTGYSLTCDHDAPPSLMATVQSNLTTPDGTVITSFPHTFNPLLVTDGGQYSCSATVSSPYLTGAFTATQGTLLDVVVEIPNPGVVATFNPTGTIFAGSLLTLTCSITLDGGLSSMLNDLSVTTVWTEDGQEVSDGGNIMVSGAELAVVTTYLSTLSFNTVLTDDAGDYICTATVSPSSSASVSSSTVTNGVGSSTPVTVAVNVPTIAVSLEPNITRLPTEPPYNTFTITCTATAPEGVVAGKTIEWMRRIGSSTIGLMGITDNTTIQIETTTPNQPVTTSVLTVTETTPGDYRYRCRVDILEINITDVDGDVYPINVIGPVAPGKPTNLMDISTSFDSTTIQWTVPQIAFTPETYVVHYGTNMGSLDLTSDPVESGDDFEAVNQEYCVPIAGLVPETEYYYMVFSTSTGGTTDSDVESFTTTPVGPDPPLNFMVTSTGQNRLTFSWEAPVETFGSLTHYTLNCDPVQPVGIPDPDPVMVGISVPPVTGTVTNLSPGVMYHCEVTATNNGGDVGSPAETDATTLEAAPTDTPQDFTTTTAARSIFFSWNPPPPTERNGIITSYTLECDPDNTNLPMTVDSPQSDLTVSDFRPYTSYTCMVFATNSQGNGPPATTMPRTMEDAPDGPPLDFTEDIVPDVPESLSFMWLPPLESLRNGNITNYSIDCIPDNTSLTTVYHDGPVTTAVVQGFTSGSQYTCFINASTSVGAGPSSEGLIVTTVPRPPENVTVSIVSASDLQVQWTPHPQQRIVSYYTVYITRMNGSEMSEVTTGRVSEYTVTGLNPFELVTIQVSANNDGGEGPRSEGVEGRTNEAPPGPVSNIVWTRQTDTTAVVSWDPPERRNGIITGYFITLTEYEGTTVILMNSAEVNVTSVDISDNSLVAGTPYTVTIRAENAAGEGMTASIHEFTRELLPPVVEGVMVRRTSGREMNVSWTPLTLVEARGIIGNYTVYITIGGGGAVKRQNGNCTPDSSPCTVDSDQSSVIVTGLDPRQSYRVSMAARTGAGSGEQSEPQIASATDTGGSSGSDNIGAIAGGVIVAVFVVAGVIGVIIGIVVFLRWKKSDKKGTQYRPYSQESTHTKMAMVEPPQTLVLTTSKPFMHSESELATFDPSQQTSPTGALDSQMMDRLKPIPIINFPQHDHEMHQDRDKGFEHEYQSVSNEPLAGYDIAKLPYNKAKNRFANIFPYDFSRVKLQEIVGVEGSDYINACYMDGYNHPNAYIAAQGPMPSTIADFWRMVWEHKLVTVVMLTKCVEAGKRKCEMYWPEIVNETLQPGANISVTLISQMPFADYEIKKFTVQDTSRPDAPPLTVTHFHFLGWPDHGVPKFATSLIAFIRRVRKGHNKEGAPMLVHCSAGVGRTGTFILLDSMLERMKVEDSVNVYEFLRNMRAKRVFMVQTLAQYVFIHDALEELVTSGETDISATNLRVKVNRLNKIIPGKAISGFDDQFRLLDQVSRKANDTDCSDALQHYNKQKNRYPDRVPYNLSRARLRPTGVTGGEYINASFIDGYKQRNAYIAAQAPLEATVSDFWRMIWEFKSKVIVMLCNLEENGHEACYPYWPVKQGEIGVYGKLQVTLQSEEPGKDFSVRKFEIKEEKAQQPTQGQQAGFVVTQLCHNHWPEHGCPTSTSSILKMIDELVKVQRNTGNRSITIVCNDGMGRTGTFICIHAQLERVKTEGVVDFFQYIKSARIHRPSLVSELEHYIFCHDTLADYLDSFDTYANFKDLGAQ